LCSLFYYLYKLNRC